MAAAAGKRERRRVILVFFKEEEQRTGLLRCVSCSLFESSIRHGRPQKPQMIVCVGLFSSPVSSMSHTWILTTIRSLFASLKEERKQTFSLSFRVRSDLPPRAPFLSAVHIFFRSRYSNSKSGAAIGEQEAMSPQFDDWTTKTILREKRPKQQSISPTY